MNTLGKHPKSNSGVFFLSSVKPETRTFVVLGTPRGGTTVAARLLDNAGIYMGAKRDSNWEDPDFAGILQLAEPREKDFLELVSKRNLAHRKWGFKAPFRYHWEFLASLRHCAFIIIHRDASAVAMRNVVSTGADFFKNFNATHHLQSRIMSFAQSTTSSCIHISYEKLIVSPESTCARLAEFLQLDDADEYVKRGKEIVLPESPDYLDSAG